MNITGFIKNATALPLIATLALYGCGGGGGSSTSMMDGGQTPGGGEMPGGGQTPGGGEMPTLMPATGLTPSAATPQYAAGAGDTIDALLPNASRTFAPLSSTLVRKFSQPRSTSIAEDAYIKTISSDGANGFHVTYVVGSDERMVHFEVGDYGTPDSPTGYFKRTEDGSRYWLWSYTGAFAGPNKNRGSASGEFRYFDVGGGSTSPPRSSNYSTVVTYGVRTEGADLPGGSATYGGRMYADRYSADDPDNNSGRTRMQGDVQLAVDFAAGTLDGKIRRIRTRAPGERFYLYMPATVYIDISGGMIVDGRFTAAWTEVNPGQAIAAGDILGEFYGPNGEELGGVINGTGTDEVVRGWIGTTRFELDPHVLSGNLSSAVSVAVDRDFAAGTATEALDTEVTSVRSDGASGFNVTYVVDGQQETVHLRAADVGFFTGTGVLYSVRQGSRGYTLDDAAGSLSGNPEFSHFNVNGWSVGEYSSDGRVQSFKRGYLTYGVATEVADLPTGTANYSGRAAGNTWDGPNFITQRGSFTGDLSLTANFDAATVGGSVTAIQYRAPGQSAFSPLGTSLSFDSGTIAGNGFSADLAGSNDGSGRYEGSADGQFYGPSAAEVGGVFQGTHTGDGTVLHGWFGGEKQ